MLPSGSVLRKLTGSLIVKFFRMRWSTSVIMQLLKRSNMQRYLLCSISGCCRRGALVPGTGIDRCLNY